MRVVALIALASCYRPAREVPCTISCTADCPGGLTCIDGLCRNADGSCDEMGDAAPIDTAPDAQSGCVLPSSFGVDTQYMGGWFYSSGGTRSIYQGSVGPNDVRETARDSGVPGVTLPSPLYGPYQVFYPRLAPTGDELFAVGSMGGAYELVHSTLSNDAWTVFEPVPTMPANIPTAAFVPGVPTSTMQRHMVVSTDNQAMFVELVEESGVWVFQQSYLAATWGFQTMVTPNLSSDGTHLVFAATKAGSTAIYMSTRSGLEMMFPAPAILYDLQHGEPEASPTLSPDCQRLFASSSGPLQVWMIQ